uniref:Uncharacterized protein n=1 Tax=Timema bartmani TaxID=61472 RepID=A0A7R9I6B9_9NEOP|nr:unnamed protein product [Timema bartmani]
MSLKQSVRRVQLSSNHRPKCHTWNYLTHSVATSEPSLLPCAILTTGPVHSYRAALEQIIVKRWPNLRHTAIKSVKHTKQITFTQYCERAVERLGLKLTEDDLTAEDAERNLSQWKQVVTFYSLRLILAPLVETVLLLDRLLFLREAGQDSQLCSSTKSISLLS